MSNARRYLRLISVSALPLLLWMLIGCSLLNSPPEASFVLFPPSGNAPLAVSFDASSSSDDGGVIVSYKWEFGDGETGSDRIETHIYETPGLYTVRLLVRNNLGGEDSATGAVRVDDPALAPGNLYVDANGGSDAVGSGTQDSPYRTITKAISAAAGTANVLHVAPGFYDAGHGEVFPLDLTNLSLVGEGATPDEVKLVGALQAFGSLTIREVRCYYQIEVHPHAQGGSSKISFVNCIFTAANSQSRISVNGGATCETRFLNCRIEDYGVGVAGGASATIQDCEFVARGLLRGEIVFPDGASGVQRVDIEHSRLVDYEIFTHVPTSIRDNVFVQAGSVPPGTYMWVFGTATIEDNTFLQGGLAASARVESGASVVMRRNAFSYTTLVVGGDARVLMEDNDVRNLYVGGTAVVDLGGGPLGSSGGNALYVGDDRISDSGPMYAVNNIWKSPQPSGEVPGPAQGPPNYSITNEGDSIIFSR